MEKSVKSGKQRYPKTQTRLPVYDLDEIAIDRRRARETMRNSARLRWGKFIAALQIHRRGAEREVREGRAPSKAAAFWYQTDTMITAFLYLTWKTFSGETVNRSDIERDLAVSKPFLAKLVKNGKAGGFVNANLTLTETSLELYFDRIDTVLDMPELRDLCDVIHILSTAEYKPERLE